MEKRLKCNKEAESLKIMGKISQKMYMKELNPSLKEKWIRAVHNWQWWSCVIILIIIIYSLNKI